MKEYRKLGEYIQQVDVRNTDLSVTHLLGVSVEKRFIESIANTIGTDFSKYKIVKKGQFTYIPDTSRRGDKIRIASLTDFDEGLVSNIYTVFEITDTTKLLPEYLMLWFSRPEFDRYARFKSHGSVREIFDWDEMCRVELPVPPLNEQQKIVDTYNAITNRIQIKQKINENLEKTALLQIEELLENPNTKKRTIKIGDICDVKGGKRLPLGSDLIEQKNSHPYIRIRDLKNSCFVVLNDEFLYVDDLANLCVFLMNNYSGNETINAGTGKELSIKELANLIANIVGYNGEIKWDASKPNGTPRKLLDISKSKQLGWKYTTEIEDGIKLSYKDFLNNKIS